MRVLEGGEARRELRRGGAPRVEPVRRGEAVAVRREPSVAKFAVPDGRRRANEFARISIARSTTIEMAATALPSSFLRSLPIAERASLLGRVEDAALRERLIIFSLRSATARTRRPPPHPLLHPKAEADAARQAEADAARQAEAEAARRAAAERIRAHLAERAAAEQAEADAAAARADDERAAAAARAAARETPHTEPVPQPPPPPPSAHAPPHAPLLSAPALHALVPTLNPDAKAWLDDTRTAAQKQFAQQRQVAELAKAVVALNQRASSADAERARLQRVVAQQSRALAASARQLQAEQRGRREQGSELKRTAARAEQLERGLRSVLRAQGAI